MNVKLHGSVTLTTNSINCHSYTCLQLDVRSVHASEVQTSSLLSLGDVCERKYKQTAEITSRKSLKFSIFKN